MDKNKTNKQYNANNANIELTNFITGLQHVSKHPFMTLRGNYFMVQT
jgi:hypothetical protein